MKSSPTVYVYNINYNNINYNSKYIYIYNITYNCY